ncbi:hypothetical protein F5883DRAFT_661548 [Diaporthe sp. PMI_573]|nr:hypothetical protein F5883DRAFT_661548 [Diaporthaceae sp. PMI_573]
MAPEADSAFSANVVWSGLTDRRRRNVCNVLASYRGPNAREHFEQLVHGAHSIQLRLEAKTQSPPTGKRTLDHGDAADAPSASKKPKVSEATEPLQPDKIDIVAPDIPFVFPTCRKPPIQVGHPTLWSTIGGRSPDARPSWFATRSTFLPSIRTTVPPFPTTSRPVSVFSLSQSANTTTKTSGQRERECDELFTIADRRSSQPETIRPQSPSAEDEKSDQSPSVSLRTSSQGADGMPTVSTVYNPPFSGVDMSSLKIPANSNVSVTLNVFQAPSSLHQNTDNDATRMLKCIRCSAVYMEAQSTALECLRHTGRLMSSNDPKFDYYDLPAGAAHVWDCCRKVITSQGCHPCGHSAE